MHKKMCMDDLFSVHAAFPDGFLWSDPRIKIVKTLDYDDRNWLWNKGFQTPDKKIVLTITVDVKPAEFGMNFDLQNRIESNELLIQNKLRIRFVQ